MCGVTNAFIMGEAINEIFGKENVDMHAIDNSTALLLDTYDKLEVSMITEGISTLNLDTVAAVDYDEPKSSAAAAAASPSKNKKTKELPYFGLKKEDYEVLVKKLKINTQMVVAKDMKTL